MNTSEMERMLPERPRPGMLQYVLDTEDVGGDFVIFHRESVTVVPYYGQVMTPEDMERFDKQIEKHWGAVCKCTACGEEFIAGWSGGNRRGIRLWEGEDGVLYDGYCEELDMMGAIEIREGDPMRCPLCDTSVRLVHSSDLRWGRTYQLAVASVENVGKYTALITWLVRRHVNEYGYISEDVRPRSAIVIGENGGLHRFAHTSGSYSTFATEKDLDGWYYRDRFSDPFLQIYYDYGAICHRMNGGITWDNVPFQGGQTGEKTAITEYIQSGGTWPYAYLRIWQQHRSIENLVKSGWQRLISNYIDETVGNAMRWGSYQIRRISIPFVRWREKKPLRMLGLSKEESRTLKTFYETPDHMNGFALWRDGAFPISAAEYAECCEFLKCAVPGKETMDKIHIFQHERGEEWALADVLRYVRQHKEFTPATVVEYLYDCRRMARNLNGGRKLTPEELWPVNLRQVHDRLTVQDRICKDQKVRTKYQEGFTAICEKYADLEWTDGELCIRLPRENGELVDEGKILRHCVGGYGDGHIKERGVIFFVRKYRRPERSYYTLDINMTGTPRRVQLHGYGNERHGKHLEKSHQIPQKVKEFCDRWEKEILMPWYFAQQQKQEKKNKKTNKKESVA